MCFLPPYNWLLLLGGVILNKLRLLLVTSREIPYDLHLAHWFYFTNLSFSIKKTVITSKRRNICYATGEQNHVESHKKIYEASAILIINSQLMHFLDNILTAILFFYHCLIDLENIYQALFFIKESSLNQYYCNHKHIQYKTNTVYP